MCYSDHGSVVQGSHAIIICDLEHRRVSELVCFHLSLLNM